MTSNYDGNGAQFEGMGRSNYGDTNTVVNDMMSNSGQPHSKEHFKPTGNTSKGQPSSSKAIAKQRDHPEIPESSFITQMDTKLAERPFFVPIGEGGLVVALERLDQQLQEADRVRLLSKKSPVTWAGSEIAPGNLGLINHGGNPKILTRPGRYPGFPLRNWWARSWCGTKGLSDTVIEFQGLTIVQVSQNQAAVISDPRNQVFVITNAGFVAYAIEGTYDILSIVDQTHLPTIVKDRLTGITLGSTHEVKMTSRVGNAGQKDYVVATFLNIPASNCAILQRGNDLELLGAGQSVITNPNVTLRGLYTLGENQLEMPTKDIFTRDQVPVSLTIYLKWQLTEPLKLATHGYSTPYEALRDKTQSILTQVIAHLDYSSMVKQRSLGPDNMDDGSDPSSAFLDALRTRAMDEMHEAALEYGIVLKDLAVIDRQFKGEIAATMDRLTTRALQAQVEAANIDRENSNKVKAEEGTLLVTRIKAQQANTQADAEAYRVVAGAKAQAEKTRIESEAQGAATRIQAEAEAEAVRIKALADANVVDQFAREMELRRIEIARVRAYGSKAVFVPSETMGAQMGSAMALGMAASMGAANGAAASK
ncbi:band 7 domain-containing protein [Coprinopsis marcescibilis]|uniref:Band 7 domain-containing protein n=1 Tax=Coprinopsis marcescibilis TaxID=230819 RepID=A0A5C3L0F2_COPMA|nr:band 7 domain-containing protein [Coprinopsis marcescibilis]